MGCNYVTCVSCGKSVKQCSTVNGKCSSCRLKEKNEQKNNNNVSNNNKQ